MSQKVCDICGVPLKNDDPVMAIIQAVYKEIPSDRSFAISQPTDCLDIAHLECYYIDRDDETHDMLDEPGAEFDD